MPASNEEFIKKAFEAGLTEEQVKSAVAERNATMGSQQPGIMSNIGSGLEQVGNFLAPATTDAIKGTIEQGPGYLTKEFETPMGTGATVAGAAMKVLPGLGASPVEQNNPLGAASRELGANIIGGELVGVAARAAGRVVSPILGKAGEIVGGSFLGKNFSKLAQKAVSKVANFSAKESAEFTEQTGGKNIVDTMYKYLKKTNATGGNQLEELYGKTASDADSVFSTEMASAEKVIQDRITKEGKKVVAHVDELLSPLYKELNKTTQEVTDQTGKTIRQALPGQEQIVEGLQNFITRVSKFGNEGQLTAKNLLDIKRLGDSKLGAAVMNEDAGSALVQGRKMITNQARDILKEKFPDLADALGIEQEIIHLKPIIRDQIHAIRVDKNFIPKAVRGINPYNPLSYPKLITENPWIINKLSNRELPLPGMDLLPNGTGQVLNRGVVTPNAVKAVEGGGGSSKPGMLMPKYLYR